MDLHNFTPDRLITISFPELAKLDASSDTLLALEATGTEAMSSPFEYQVKFLSFDVTITDEDFLAEPAVIKISQPHCAPKIVHGIVDRVSETRVSASSPFRLFSVRVVPRLALLKESLDYRIYQNQSVLEMIKLIFKFCHAGKLDFSRLTKTYAPIDYCVQYSESYFDFLSRMCEQHKIFYYCETREKPSNSTMTEYEHVICFEDFGQPKETYPDKTIAYNSPHYQDKTMSDCTFTTVAPSQYTIKSNVSDLHVGQTFTLTNHHFDFFKQAYFVTSFQCHAQDYSQQDYFKSTEQQPLNTIFESQFSMLGEKQLPYVVEEKTPKPVGHYETAIVSGYDDDEIYTDELGRVTVSFPWDHHGKKDHTSSCWVPVMKTTSGESHSSNFLPRVGDEVLIHYENGNPDKPIITGCFYNAENLPPFDPEETPYKSGIKTRTLESIDPDEGNWISFDDDPDNPNIEIHAQKDMKTVVKQDYQRDVQADASLTINQGDFKHSTGGELHMNASKEIRFSCGNSAVVLDEEGISFEGNKIEVIKAAVPTPVLPPGDVIANMVKTLDEVSNPPEEPSASAKQDDKIVAIIYATQEKKFYALTQSEHAQITQMEDSVNQPREALQQLLQQAENSPASEAEKLAEALKKQRESCLSAVKSLTNNQPEQLAEIVHLSGKRTWGYINRKALSTAQYVVDHTEINLAEAKNAIANALKNKVQEKSVVTVDVTIIDEEVDGTFNQWTNSINQRSPQELFSNDYMSITSEDKLMRYSMGASISGSFDAVKKAFTFKDEIKCKVDLYQGKLTTTIDLPGKGNYHHFQLNDSRGQCLDLGLFEAQLALEVHSGAGACLQLGGEIKFDLSKGKTIAKGFGTAGEAEQFFAGASVGCNLTGSLYWANPENLNPPTDQSKQYEHIQAKGDLQQATMRKLASVGGGIEVCTGIGLGEKFKIAYEDQRFYIVTSAKAVAGFGIGGRICLEVMVDTIKEFFLFLYHQIKNHNYNYTGLFKDVAYYAWVSIFTVATWAGHAIEDYVKSGVNKAGEWLQNLAGESNSIAHMQHLLIDNLSKHPERIAQAPPETKGQWLYYLCQAPLLSKEYWQKDFLHRQDVIVSILHHIQSDNEYQTVCEFMLPINPQKLDSKPKKQSASIGHAILWLNKQSVMYTGAEIRYELEALSAGLGKQLNEVAKTTYNQAQYRPVAFQFLQTTALMGVWSH